MRKVCAEPFGGRLTRGNWSLEVPPNEGLSSLMNRLLYTIMPDFGGAYAWVKDSTDATPWVGGNCADCFGGLEDSWYGEHPISVKLARDFANWQLLFEAMSPVESTGPLGGWQLFHEVGIALTYRLRAELGGAADVRYLRPMEDPGRSGQRELHLDGQSGRIC